MAKNAKPTPAQRRVLENIQAGKPMTYGINGASEHGGFYATLFALHRRKWITSGANAELTDEGRAALAK